MENKKYFTVAALSILAIIVILLIVFIPSKSKLSNIDFYVFDSNDNYHFEVNEPLEFIVNDSLATKGKDLIWQMGNGDTIKRGHHIKYVYKEPGKYLVTLKIDKNHSIHKYIKVISVAEHAVADSIPKIYAVSEAYQGEEIVFSAEGEGMTGWQWEFGESGTVDAYEKQVVYTYEEPGEYTVSLQTNTTKYPITHKILILSRFEKAEEIVTVDSLTLAQDDIKYHLQAIANAKVSQKSIFYDNVNYIRNTYFCTDADQVVVVINDDKYNDFLGYCQGLHYLESNKTKRVNIDDVKIDDIYCVTTIHVKQSYLEK